MNDDITCKPWMMEVIFKFLLHFIFPHFLTFILIFLNLFIITKNINNLFLNFNLTKNFKFLSHFIFPYFHFNFSTFIYYRKKY